MAQLSLHLLGSPHIEMDGLPVEPDTRKATALLVYLVISGESHTREALAALLWPEYDQASARAALRRTLSALRKALRQEALAVHGDSIGLLPGLEVWSDVAEFRKLQTASAGRPNPPGEVCRECLDLLAQAIALYRGDFMAGFTLRDSSNFDDWQFFETEKLRSELAVALEKLAYGSLQAGEFEAAIAAARRWSALDPLNEAAQRGLMQCYAAAGQRAAALRQYRECVRILEQELGVAPLEETTALYRAILEHNESGGPPIPAAPWPAGGPAPGSPPSEGEPAAAYPRAGRLPLVGRARQMALLQQAYDRTGTKGYFMVLEGEPGVGKTRLAEELLAQVRSQGGRVVQARCYEGEDHLAYGPFIEGFSAALAQPEQAARLKALPEHWRGEAARLLPELGGPAILSKAASLDNPGAQSRFFEGLRQALIKLGQGYPPGVLFLDDLQWVDAASLDLLTYLVRRLQGSGLFILATWRGELSQAGHRLSQLLADAERAGSGARLHLNRLSQAEVGELVRAAALPAAPAEFSERLYRETEGLPFFLSEYLEDLGQAGAGISGPAGPDWSIPTNVRDLLRARLASAGETGWQLLTTAAVIGRSFDFNTLREASGRSELEALTGLEALLSQGLVQEQAAGREAGRESGEAGRESGEISYDFSHDKLRILVLEETSRTRQRLLHRRVAEVLAGQPRSRAALAGQIARHYHLADQEELAAEYYKLAGEHARSVYANVEALAYFQEALAAGHPQAAGLHEAIGDLHTLAGEYSAALNRYQTASALAGPPDLPRLEHKLGIVHHRRGEWELAVSYFRAALEALGDGDPAGLRARLYADWSRTAHQQDHPQQAGELAARAVELAEQAGDAAAQGQAHNILGILARNARDWDQARLHLERSLAVARQAGDVGMQAAALNNLALVSGDQGDLDQAIRLAHQALELCARQGDRHREAALYNNLADLYHAAGQAEQAMRHLKKAVVIFAEIGGEAGQMQSETWMLTEW